MHVLLIEDDLELGSALQKALGSEGLTSEWVRRGADAPAYVQRHRFDCVLLDLTLPDADGLDILRHCRQNGLDVPIIVITARTALDDRLEGLDGGADDFMIKPFAIEELLSRIRVVVRRHSRQADNVWVHGRLSIDTARHQVMVDGGEVALAPREYAILLQLAREAGRVVSKDALAQCLQPLGDPLDINTVEAHMSNLRRKIGAELVRTIRGVGYVLQT
ncbi:response regulator [Chitinimonas sp.]|uniref:response regulator n=1 Tax=Chitinimonas sp. TaxID=1934313 RepID=UPI0035B40EAA